MSQSIAAEMLVKISADVAQLRAEMATVKRDVGGALGSITGMAGEARTALMGLVGVVGVTALAKGFVDMADGVASLDARLKLATGNAQDFKAAQADTYRIAQQNAVGLKETTELYTKLYDPVKRLGGGVRENTAIVEAFALSLRIGGADTQAAAAATLQFAQAMGSGRLQGDEFRSIAEASPRTMKALAEGMKVPIETLKKMGSEGKLTADVVGNALIKSLDKLKSEAGSIPVSVSASVTRLKNDVMLAVDEINRSAGTTQALSGLIEQARGLIPMVRDELLGAFQAVGAWIDSNRDGLVAAGSQVGLLVGQVWSLVKAGAGVVGFLAESASRAGVLKTGLEAVRLIVAGLSDGVEFVAATFAKAGGYMLDLAGLFSDTAAKAAKEAHAAADSVFARFANGDSAVARLGAELQAAQQQANATAGAMLTTAGAAAQGAAGMREAGSAAGASAGPMKTLKNAHAELTEEQKKALEAYKKVINGINEKTAAYMAELQAGEKLTDGQRLALKVMEDIRNGELKLTDAQKRTTVATLERMLAQDRLAESHKAALKWEEDARKMREHDADLLVREADSLREKVDSARLENEAIGKTRQELSKIEVARLRDQAAIMGQVVASEARLKECTRETEAHKATLQALKDLADAREKGDALRTTQELREEWQKLVDQVGDGLTDALMRAFEAGKSFADAFKSTLINAFKTMVLQPVIRAVLQPVGSAAMSAMGFSGSALASQAGGLAGAGTVSTGALGLASMASSLWDFVSGGWQQSMVNGIVNVAGGLGNLGATSTSAWMANNSGMLADVLGGAGGFLAGRGIGSAISGGYSAIGSSGNTATNIGAAIGAIWGPLGSVIGGALGGLVNRAFGMGQKSVTGSGIQGSLQGGGVVNGQSWAAWQQDGGWFRSDRNGTDYSAMPADVASALNSGTTTLLQSTKAWADALKLPSQYLDKVSVAFKVSLTDKAEENTAAITKVLQDYEAALGAQFKTALTPFQKAGETLQQTGQRLVVVQSFSEAINSLGGIFGKVAALSVNAKESLLGLAGGVDALLQKSQTYAGNYYDINEQMGIQARSVMEALTKAGIMPAQQAQIDSMADMRALVESVDLSAPGGLEKFNSLLDIANQFADVGKFMEQYGGTLGAVASRAPQQALLWDSILKSGNSDGANGTIQVVSAIDRLHSSNIDLGEKIEEAIGKMTDKLQDALERLRYAFKKGNADLLDSIMFDGGA